MLYVWRTKTLAKSRPSHNNCAYLQFFGTKPDRARPASTLMVEKLVAAGTTATLASNPLASSTQSNTTVQVKPPAF